LAVTGPKQGQENLKSPDTGARHAAMDSPRISCGVKSGRRDNPNTIQPALLRFRASLNNEQKARFDRLGVRPACDGSDSQPIDDERNRMGLEAPEYGGLGLRPANLTREILCGTRISSEFDKMK